MVPAGLIARFGVPMLALGVASTQMMCATQGTLTPWKGGGFGMFASIDGPGTRVLATQAVDDSGNQYRVVIGGPTQSGPSVARAWHHGGFCVRVCDTRHHGWPAQTRLPGGVSVGCTGAQRQQAL